MEKLVANYTNGSTLKALDTNSLQKGGVTSCAPKGGNSLAKVRYHTRIYSNVSHYTKRVLVPTIKVSIILNVGCLHLTIPNILRKSSNPHLPIVRLE